MSAAPTRARVAVTGAAGALGSAYVRALAAHGYDVVAIDRRPGALRVFTRTFDNPFDRARPEDCVDVPIVQVDLARDGGDLVKALEGVHGLVMTAANPLPFQSRESAAANHTIDLHSIDAAIAAGVRVLIYTSSLWRLHRLLDGNTIVTPDLSAPEGHYGESKQRTVDAMQSRAAQHADVRFVVNDHGWYPREAIGAPPMNVHDRGLQTWVAETETQQHILRQLELPGRTDLAGNYHGFIVTSRNVPTEAAVRHGHRPFIYDLSSSAAIGVVHRANVYELYEQYGRWRQVPIYME